MNGGPARVLDALRRAGDDPCSGETLSARRGVSRAQVWKDVEALRSRGYTIDAAPGGGYRLVSAPDRLYSEEIAAALGTKWLGCEIHHLECTDSTNRVALELARDGCAHGTSVIAEAQTAGRGRMGRSFYSPPYANLYTSIVLRPVAPVTDAPAWILASAVGVANALVETLGRAEGVEIKWPNDVLIGGHKTCGILTELGAEGARISFLVVGIGVNLNVDPASFPDEFRGRATSVAHGSGGPIDRVRFTQRLYRQLERAFDACAESGFDALRPHFERYFAMAGQPVHVQGLDGTQIRGTALGIDDDGALRILTSGGETRRVIAGDVTIAKEPR